MHCVGLRLENLSMLSQYYIRAQMRRSNFSFHVFTKSLTNDSYEHRQSVVENRPSTSWCMAGCVVFHFLVNFYVEYCDHTIFSILVCIRALLAQRALEPCGQFTCNFKLHYDIFKIGQSLAKSPVNYCALYIIYIIFFNNIHNINFV
jgi:hypothetical protein